MKPTFLGLGAQRCGTTWAYECLQAHPEVFVSTPKELRYFSKHYDKGPAWYESHFDKAGDAAARGEITPGYIYRSQSLQRIAADVPDARLLLFLRNPVERASSAYKFFRDKYYRGLSFWQAMEQDHELLEQGVYVPLIERMYEHFDQEQVQITFFDDIVERPDEVLHNMYAFLGVDPRYRPAVEQERVNSSILPRTQFALSYLKLDGLIEIVKRSPIGPSVRRFLSGKNATRYESLNEEEKSHLKKYYAEDVQKLSVLMSRDLSHWIS